MKGQQKIKRGRGFRGALDYAMENGRGRIIGGNMCGQTPRELAKEFGQSRALRPDIDKPVWHNSLRLPAGERISDEAFVAFADDYMKKMAFSDLHQRCYILHDDEDGQHIHILASRIGLDKSIYLGKQENLISTRMIHELEKVHGLSVHSIDTDPMKTRRKAITAGEKGLSERTDEAPVRMRLQVIIDAAAKDKPTFDEFVKRLEARGVSIEPSGKTGKNSGISFELDDVAFAGSKLGDSYKWAQLTKRIDFNADRDQHIIDRLRLKATQTREDSKGEIAPVEKSEPVKQRWNRTLDLAFTKSEDGIYTWKKRPEVVAIIDRGDTISVRSKADSAIKASLQLAKTKGWSSVVASGNETFRRKSWLLGSEMGLRVTGYEPTKADQEELNRLLQIKQERAHGRKNNRNAPVIGEQRERGQDSSRAVRIDTGNGSDADSSNERARDTDKVSKDRPVQNPAIIPGDRGGHDTGITGHENRPGRTEKTKAGSDYSRRENAAQANSGVDAHVQLDLRRIAITRDALADILARRSHREERPDTTRYSDAVARIMHSRDQRIEAHAVGVERDRRIESIKNDNGTYQKAACKIIEMQERNGKSVDWSEVDREITKKLFISLRDDDDIKDIIKAGSPVFADKSVDVDQYVDDAIIDLRADEEVMREYEVAVAAEAARKAAIVAERAKDHGWSMGM